MSVEKQALPFPNAHSASAVGICFLCDAARVMAMPVDDVYAMCLLSLQVLAESYPHKDTLWNDYECPKFIPFNPVDKYTIAVIRDLKSGEMMRVMKGAPQVSHTFKRGVLLRSHGGQALRCGCPLCYLRVMSEQRLAASIAADASFASQPVFCVNAWWGMRCGISSSAFCRTCISSEALKLQVLSATTSLK